MIYSIELETPESTVAKIVLDLVRKEKRHRPIRCIVTQS